MMLTAVVTNYNYSRYLNRCIDSCLSQGVEVVVVDNASTDGSREILRDYGDLITTVLHESNTGSCVQGMNEGIELADTEWLMFLDADDFLLSGGARLLTSRDCDWLVADLLVVGDDAKPLDRWRYDLHPRDEDGAYRFARDNGSLPVSMKGAFRTEWVKSNGLRYLGWETVDYAEDLRTCLEWVRHSPRIAYVDGIAVAYRYNEKTAGDSVARSLMLAELATYLEEDRCK